MKWKLYRICCVLNAMGITGMIITMFLMSITEEEVEPTDVYGLFFLMLLGFGLFGLPVVIKNFIGHRFTKLIESGSPGILPTRKYHFLLYAFHLAIVVLLYWMLFTVNYGFHLNFHWSHLSQDDWHRMLLLFFTWLIALPSSYILVMDIILWKKINDRGLAADLLKNIQ